MFVMIDNYDSFTYNLVHYFRELGTEISVYRNDELSLSKLETLQPQGIIISPGPCTPNEAGISLPLIQHFAGSIPILGVCLGHQSIAQCFAANIVPAIRIMHGKTSKIYHHDSGVFHGLPQAFIATRYHSLVVDPHTLPECLEVTAWTEDAEQQTIMGFRHKHYFLEGVQFHPESILSQAGHALLNNFIRRSQTIQD